MTANSDRSKGVLFNALRDWLSTPPRAHGDVDEHRTVSHLELFYDLVFVVLVSQIAHTLGAHVGWSGVINFSIVFALIWIAWLNGSMYHEVHGRADGRSRSYIFLQMLVLAALAVFAGHAMDDNPAQSRPFGILYALLLMMIAFQWWRVRPYEPSATARRTVLVWVSWMTLVSALVAVGGFLGVEARAWCWALGSVVFALTMLLSLSGPEGAVGTITDSATERFSLFTIIVLGEVVVGVVNGMIEGGATPIVVVTGLLSLVVGFGLWWNYFDAVGGALPIARPYRLMVWTLAHLPLTASIAATGAGMVSLIAHADATGTPAPTAWLLAGATASMLVWLSVVIWTVEYEELREAVRRPFIITNVIAALLCLALAWWAPTPWLFALLLGGVLGLTWWSGFVLLARTTARLGITHVLRLQREQGTA